MAPGLGDRLGKQGTRHLRQPNQDRRIVSVVVREEECGGIDLHQDVAVVDRRELQNEDLVIVPESSEKPTVQ